ncbi:MAG: hypothetical protein ACK551_01490 [Vampirovibrionales bacterium]
MGFLPVTDPFNGGAGNDTMIAAAGDDTYSIDSLSDSVVELATEGNDTLHAYVNNHVLAANVENLILQGSVS